MNPVMGIDLGKVRIGLAISDELRMLAHPLETIPADRAAIARIAQIVRDRKIEAIVAGVPKTMGGQMGTAAKEAMVFVEKLKAAVACKVITWDERLTTVAANRALRDAGKKTKDTRGYVDQVAAQLILQGYLDQQEMALGGDDLAR
jgi:putative Holliday junction resolvase